MTFKDRIKSDVVNIFLNENEFAEEITYTPKGGSAKTIKAIVDRKVLNPAAETANRIFIDEVDIPIATDATYGVVTVNRGGDKVTLPDENGVSRTYNVGDIIGNDNGAWRLLLRK